MEATVRRLARAVQERLGSSYSFAKRQVETGRVRLNGAVATNPGELVHAGDTVEHVPDAPRMRRAGPAPPIEILHLDDDVVVVDKPAGLLVHPTIDGEQDTVLTRAAAAIERRTGRHQRVLVVHRLDRETSGVMVLALSHKAAEHLQRQFRAHTIDRRYLALVGGALDGELLVDRAIGRPRPSARRAALAPGHGGRSARTVVRPVEALGDASLVEAELGTGRTHQVRVHLAYLGHPVLADSIYGEPDEHPIRLERLALHAAVLGFVHPISGERLDFRVPLPADLSAAVARLRSRRARRPAPATPRGAPSRPGRPAGAAATTRPRPRTPRLRAGAAGPGTPAPTGRRKPARPHPPRRGPHR